jgi:hypothetical protein
MVHGFVYLPGAGRIKWMDDEPRFWTSIIGRIGKNLQNWPLGAAANAASSRSSWIQA